MWRTIDDLDRRERFRERSPYYLLSRFISGDVFHVDSLVNNTKVIFAGANKYGRPPMDVAHKGGAYISHTIPHRADDEKKLFQSNQKLLKTLGLKTGAAHAEFIKSAADGEFYFLEVAARVGGAYIAHHAGLIVRSKKLERVQELLTEYATRFAEDFEAVLPPLERAE